jgi:hypothetical protein
MKSRAAVGLVVGALIVVVAACWIYISRFGQIFSDCGDDVRETVVSPAGGLAASRFIRNCGATTSFVTMISVRRSTDSLNTKRDTVVFATRDQCPIQATWRRDTLLVLGVPAWCHPTQRAGRWAGLRITTVSLQVPP